MFGDPAIADPQTPSLGYSWETKTRTANLLDYPPPYTDVLRCMVDLQDQTLAETTLGELHKSSYANTSPKSGIRGFAPVQWHDSFSCGSSVERL